MQGKVEYLLEMRQRAKASGDISQVRAWDADLARLGIFPETTEPMETTVADPLPERAVPPQPKRGRMPRGGGTNERED